MEFAIEKSIPLLDRAPRVFRTMLEGLDESWTHRNEGSETWSAFDVMGHLLHGEVTDWIPRLEIILNDGPIKTFKPFDRFAQFKESEGKTLHQLLDEFETARKYSMEKLMSKNITEKDYNRTGIHPSFGTVTLSQLLSTWTVHDLTHINQIARVMARQYQDAIGPWREYINMLQ